MRETVAAELRDKTIAGTDTLSRGNFIGETTFFCQPQTDAIMFPFSSHLLSPDDGTLIYPTRIIARKNSKKNARKQYLIKKKKTVPPPLKISDGERKPTHTSTGTHPGHGRPSFSSGSSPTLSLQNLESPSRGFSSRRPRWLGRWSACLSRSISWVQVSPSAHARRDFFLQKRN